MWGLWSAYEKLDTAKSSIQNCLSLLEHAYQLMNGTASIPPYEVTEPVGDFLQTMSYKAMVEGDAEPQYLAGRIGKTIRMSHTVLCFPILNF